MPLLDHFAPPLSRTHPWRGFHAAWAGAIVRHLNGGILPAGFYAIPNVDLDAPVEIDVATLREAGALPPGGALWDAPAPAVDVALDFPAIDLVEVQVMHGEGDPRLVASIELASESNKDRPASRRAFSVKCASYLHEGSSVVVVDPVTVRSAGLHAELHRLLELPGEPWRSATGLSAVSYQAQGEEDRRLRVWTNELAVGGTLPVVPLWLGGFAVPLDLEATHSATCRDLRIPPGGLRLATG
ncbi:MAG: hypothetical protein K2W96_10140 [Gemmataceae bacterium]|nr:hypothetical protein [Gemmataceae bacterium]